MAGILSAFAGGVGSTVTPAVDQAAAAASRVGNFARGVASAVPSISPGVAAGVGEAVGGAGVIDLAGRGVTAALNNTIGPGDNSVEKAQKELNAGTWRQHVPNWLDQAGQGLAIGAHALLNGNKITDDIYSLGEPSAPPTVVGQTPAKPAAPIAPAVAPLPTLSAPAPTAAIGVSAPSPAPAPAVSAGNSFTDMNTPGAMRSQSGATSTTPAPVAAPIKAPALNPVIMEQQQQLMAQIAAAQGVVQAGSNRDGYKMGDVTKALATMNHLSPLVASSNNLMGANYGADAGIINHAADNTTRTNISNAGNATEMAKADLAGQYGVAGHKITAQANMQLAQQKAQLEALSPAGQKALVEARTAARNFDDTAGLTGAARVRAVTGKAQDFQQVKSGTTGNLQGIMVDGNFVPMLGADAELVNPQPKKKK